VFMLKGDRKSIGYKKSEMSFHFTDHTVRMENGMSFYLFSDGFVDQLDENDQRFGTSRIKELLKECQNEPFEKQRELLLEAFNKHKGTNDRQDDMTVLGFGIREGE